MTKRDQKPGLLVSPETARAFSKAASGARVHRLALECVLKHAPTTGSIS